MTQAGWKPVVGRLTDDLIDGQSLDDLSKERLVASAVRTLARCGSPEVEGTHSAAHLVVGEVQSGKTLAFTTLMALARDNGFRLIIVIAGTKTNLLDQTIARLDGDLLAGTGTLNPWRVWDSPDASVADDIRSLVSKRRDPSAKIDGSQTAVLFVLKHGGRLKRLREALDAIGDSVLRRTPALIIDDEADQASLNLSHDEGERSPIYRSIAELRAALPRHDFMMYTATPQGPLLVELEDELSPETVTVLESGPSYVGGSELFGKARDDYVRLIPDAELEAALEPGLGSPSPPPSLRTAIATFLLALVIAQERRSPRPLSMLIHPATARDLHHQYASWARSIRDGLIGKLDDPKDVVFADTLASDLQAPYDDLAKSVDQIPALPELAELIPPYAQQLEVREVNQGSKPIEAWGNFPGWILVGGNKLERGFTIENLAVTYMPRGPGVGNADTIQQRGRFFGYKRGYLDLCRGWFTAEVADAFADYVEHEETMHEALRVVDRAGQPLRTWRRELILSPQLRPTRRKVISLSTTRQTITRPDGWFGQAHLLDPASIATNVPLAGQLFASFRADATAERLDPRGQHQAALAPLGEVHKILAGWGAAGSDAQRLLGVSLLIGRLLEDERASDCRIVFMDGAESVDGEAGRRRRSREQAEGPTVTFNIFQGRDDGTGYPGDRAIFDPKRVTLQLHVLDLGERGGKPLAEGVPAIAVHLTREITTLILED